MTDVNDLLLKAQQLYNNGNPLEPYCTEYTEAMTLFEKTISIVLSRKEVYNLRWHIQFLRKDYDSTLNDLNVAIDLDPTYVSALYNRGYLNKHLGSVEDSRKDFLDSL